MTERRNNQRSTTLQSRAQESETSTHPVIASRPPFLSLRAEGVAIPLERCFSGDCFVAYAPRNDERVTENEARQSHK